MGDNAKSGHTTGLTDGDYILSPSFTNLYEGLHGNGILALEDGAVGDGDRNTPADMPGAISASTNVLTIKGGYAVIDGIVVAFGGGYDSNAPDDYTVTLEDSRIEGNQSALTTGQSVLLVVYVCSDGGSTKKNIYVEMGTPVSSGYPVTPEGFLSDPNSSLVSKQTTVLGIVKCVYSSGTGDLDMTTAGGEILDRRTFLRPSPIYMTPVSTGAVGATVTDSNRVDMHTDLDGIHGGGDENGALTNSELGALWMSYSNAGDNVLYFSGKQGGARRSYRLGPDKLSTSNASQTFRFDGPNFFHATPTGNITLTPSGTFPPSHTVTVNNAASATHNIAFDPSGINSTVGPASAAVFAYNGSAWVKIFASSSSSSASGGSTGDVQYNDGSSGFSGEGVFTYNAGTNTLTVGVVSTAGLISAPTGVQFGTGTATNPGSATTLWRDSDDSRLYFNTSKVLLDGDSIATNLNALSAAAVDVAADSIGFIDANDSNNSKKESIADLATAMAGTGISASSGVLNLDAAQTGITSIGPASGTLTVSDDLTVTGDLIVSGATTTLNVATIDVADKNINLGSGLGNDAAVDGGGITLESSSGTGDKTIAWVDANDAWTFNQHIYPSADSALNLGSNTIRFATGYLDALTTGTITGSGDVTIDTNVLKVDTAGDKVGILQASPEATFQVKETGFGYGSGTLAAGSNNGSTVVNDGTSSTGIVLFHSQKFRAGKLLVEVANEGDDPDFSTGRIYETAEMVITHNGRSNAAATEAYLTTYGVVTSGGGTLQGAYNVAIVSGNVELQVTPTVSSDDITVRVSWQAMTI
jgi:hypothetical protein